jgi:hypothetical protein
MMAGSIPGEALSCKPRSPSPLPAVGVAFVDHPASDVRALQIRVVPADDHIAGYHRTSGAGAANAAIPFDSDRRMFGVSGEARETMLTTADVVDGPRRFG